MQKNNIKITGINFENEYVEINNQNSKNLYNEIYYFLYSIKQNEKDIYDLQIQLNVVLEKNYFLCF